MSTWHTYPTYIRLTDNSHVPIVLLLDLDTRDLVGAAVADTPDIIEQWLIEFISIHGVPEAVVHVDGPTFPGLAAALGGALTRAGCRGDLPSTIDEKDLVWAIEHGGRLSAAIQTTAPCSVRDVAHELHTQLTQPQGHRP